MNILDGKLISPLFGRGRAAGEREEGEEWTSEGFRVQFHAKVALRSEIQTRVQVSSVGSTAKRPLAPVRS